MFTHKDIQVRTIFVVNCLEKRNLRVSNGELLLEEETDDGKKTLTKLPFQKMLALFVIGHITITTPLIEKCTKYGIPLIVMKLSLRPIFFFSITAEANYLLRQKQYLFSKDDISISKILVDNKIQNQLRLLEKTRLKTQIIENAKQECSKFLIQLSQATHYEVVMGIEGKVSKIFFAAYFDAIGWTKRCPRAKIDPLNVTLDIGYTVLFNFIEAFVRLFGFDPYVGVYHRLWFKRKSLICDLIEPFRCIIDRKVRKAFNTKQCKADDFVLQKNEYILKKERSSDYYKIFYEVLIEQKKEIFEYVRNYYRCFMQKKSVPDYPQFLIK